MKALALALIVASLGLPSSASVRVLALCSTSDGEYSISVTDNQGALPLKKSLVIGAIKDSDGIFVSSCFADAVQIQETNFGYRYLDRSTQGERLLLEVSPTRAGRFHLEAVFEKNGSLVRLSDFEMQCSAFNTHLPGR